MIYQTLDKSRKIVLMTLHTFYVLTLIRLPWLTVPSSSSSGRRRRSRDSRFTASITPNNSANSNPPSAPFSPNKHARPTQLPRRSSCRMQFPHSLTVPSPQAAIDVVAQLEAATRQLRGLHRCKVIDQNHQPVEVLNLFCKVVEQLVPVLFSAAAVVQRVIQQVAPYPILSYPRTLNPSRSDD